jgi:hypothetical protein
MCIPSFAACFCCQGASNNGPSSIIVRSHFSDIKALASEYEDNSLKKEVALTIHGPGTRNNSRTPLAQGRL